MSTTEERAVCVVAQLRSLPPSTRESVFELLRNVHRCPTTPETEPRVGLELLELLADHPSVRSVVSSYLSFAWKQSATTQLPRALHAGSSGMIETVEYPSSMPASELLASLANMQ